MGQSHVQGDCSQALLFTLKPFIDHEVAVDGDQINTVNSL